MPGPLRSRSGCRPGLVTRRRPLPYSGVQNQWRPCAIGANTPQNRKPDRQPAAEPANHPRMSQRESSCCCVRNSCSSARRPTPSCWVSLRKVCGLHRDPQLLSFLARLGAHAAQFGANVAERYNRVGGNPFERRNPPIDIMQFAHDGRFLSGATSTLRSPARAVSSASTRLVASCNGSSARWA
jgi:hypothetical protein